MVLAAAVLAACTTDEALQSPATAESRRALALAAAPEEEVFGDVWNGKGRISSFQYSVTLRNHPSDSAAYFARGNRPFEATQPVDPQGPSGHNWGWYHIFGGRAECTGGPNDVEVHRVSFGGSLVPAAAGTPEQHCIGTGRFIVELYKEDGSLVKSREIDFISAASSPPIVEETVFGTNFIDNVVHFDIGGGNPAVTPVIDPVPAGPAGSHFQFNAGGSTTAWNKDLHRGRLSVEWLWDTRNQNLKSLFMNTQSNGVDVVRVHRYVDTGTLTAQANLITPSTNGALWSATTPVQVNPAFPLPGTICIVVTRQFIDIMELKVRFDCPTSSTGNAEEHQWDFGDGTVTSWMSGTSELTHTYPAPGTYMTTVEAREIIYPSNTAQNSEAVTAQAPINGATSGGNSFPSTMAVGQFYAVSVYMDNTGNTTWSGSEGYGLTQVTPGTFEWVPMGVGMGPGTVGPGSRQTFSFNLYNEATAGAYYDVYYAMQQSGTLFGAWNGRTIEVLPADTCTKNCGFAFDLEATVRSYPGGASEAGPGRERDTSPDGDTPVSIAVGEVLQTLAVRDYRPRFQEENGLQVARIRYFGALAEPWAVDATFRIVFEPGTINLGLVRRGLATNGYGIEVMDVGPGEVTVRLRRLGIAAALPTGDNLLLEIPIVALSADRTPATLPLVELTVTR